jgi:hypothetical protein
VNWTAENEARGTTRGAGVSFSREYDYQSFGANLLYSKKTGNRNGEFTTRLQVYFDQLKYILPIELRPNGGNENDYPTKPRNSYRGSLSYSQIINQRLQLMFIADLVYQQGYLGLPFHRVYFKDQSLRNENLPDSRLKIPLGFRANYYLGDKFILRSFYRYYHDNWGLNAHTLQLETAVKLSPFFSVTPFYRYYTQNSIDYFAPIYQHASTDSYYASNYDLSEFNSHFFGGGFRLVPQKGVLGIQHITALELRYGHYMRSNNLHSDIVSLNLQFK